MRVVLNGVERELPDGATVADAVRESGAPAEGRGVAVAVDGEVLPRGEWGRFGLSDGRQIEVLQAVQGG
jgi:sulfur carrier protein